MRKLCPNKKCCSYFRGRFAPHFLDEHINDQAHCVFLPGGESLVDYVGDSARVSQDWQHIVAAINERSGSNFSSGAVVNPNGRGGPDGHGVENACQCAQSRNSMSLL